MFTRPWFSLLRRQVLIHRRSLAFLLTVAAVLLGWQAFVARAPLIAPISSSPAAEASVPAVPPGWVRMPVRFADGEMAALLRPGQRIQLWATDARAARSVEIARDAMVVAVPEQSTNGVMSTQKSRLVIVGIRVTEVNKVTISGVGGFLTYALDH